MLRERLVNQSGDLLQITTISLLYVKKRRLGVVFSELDLNSREFFIALYGVKMTDFFIEVDAIFPFCDDCGGDGIAHCIRR